VRKSALLLVFAVLLVLVSSNSVSATWWNETWDYKKEINITNTLVSTNNYAVKVNLNVTSLYTAGKINATCQDIRFVNGTNFILNHWVESCNITGGNSTFWANVTSIPKNVTTTIYMYYGNDISTYNNTIGGKRTFLVYSDWNDNTTDGYVTDAGTYDNPEGTYLRASGAGAIGHTGIQCSNCSATADIRVPTGVTVQEMGIIARYNDPANDQYFYLWRIQSTTACEMYINPYVLLGSSTGTYAANTWYKLELAMYGSNLTGFINNVQKVSVINNTYSTGYVGFLSNINAYKHYDNLRVRNYIVPEPTISIGAEETPQPPPPQGTPTVTAHVTSPTTVYPNTDLKFNMTATDSDNATINGYVQFYVNGIASGAAQSQAMTNNTNTLIGTLSHSSFGVGNTLIAEYWASDGINTTTKANHSTVTVQSGAPNLPVLVSPANNSISGINAVNLSVNVTDNQGDVMNVSFYSNLGWCYQETANVSTACGGLATGVYTNINNSYPFYVNYSKPTNSLNLSLWQVKHGNESSYNISIPTNCWNQVVLQFRFYSHVDGTGNDESHPECYNGTSWMVIGNNYSIVDTGVGSFSGISSILWHDSNWATNSGHSLNFPYFRDALGGNWQYGAIYEEAMWWHTDSYIGNDTNIANGSTATYEWTDITDGIYNWYAVVTDGYESNTSSVWTFSIDTTAPTYSNVGINDTNVQINDSVLFYALWSDAVGDLNYSIFSWNNTGTWVNDSAVALTAWSNVTKILNSAKGEYAWKIYANDSLGHWNNTGAQTFTMNNTAPTDPTDITGFPANLYVTNTLTLTATGGTDVDNDTITYYYKFYNVNESNTRQDWSATNTYTIQVSDAHDTIRVYAKSTTIDANSSGNYNETDFVDDTVPTNPTDLTLTVGDVKVTETLTGTCTNSVDADSDVITYHYQFYNTNDTAERQAYSSDNTYVIAIMDAHDNMRVRCKAVTNYGESSGYDEENKQIIDTLPTTPAGSSLTAGDVKVTETLTGTGAGSTDADSDVITYHYQFYNTNDSIERQAKSSDNTYVIVVTDAHDNIRVRIWATTTYGDSAAYEDENKQIANTAPTQPTLTNPANNEINNTLTMNWTASTDADSDTIYYYVLMNGTQACYTTGLNCSYDPPDAYYQWNVTAYDGSANGTTSTSRYFTYDTVSPTITLNPSNAFTATNTSTISNYNSTAFPLNITFADERDLFAAEINITNSTGHVMFNWTNISSISGLSYTYNNTLNNTAWTAGLYIINITVSDSHTSMLIDDYELTKQKDELVFETPEANKITIKAVNAINSDTIKKGDRYQFEFSYPDTVKDTLVYNIESDNEIYYRPDSGYKAHFVIWNPRTKTGNWVDFEDVNLKDYTVQKVDDKHYTITFSMPQGIEAVTFNSIGGLNVVTKSYSWYMGLTTQSYTSPVLTNITTSFYLNATNTSVISDINARFFYNYTEYTVTKTTSADYGFKATVITPSITVGTQNFNFTWNVSVNQTDSTQYNFSELKTQTVSTAQINVTIKDEIGLYMINNETFDVYVINEGRYYTTSVGYILIGNLSAGIPYIEIENSNYPRRGYYITISENLTTYLTAYILRSSPSTQEIVFTIQNSGLTKLEDAKMTFYRMINMTYVEVGQIETDYAGQAALTLDTKNEYRIVIEASGYPIKTLNLRPIQTTYIITLQETGTGFVNFFEGIAYTITPVNRTFNVSQNYTNFRLDIYSSNSDLEVFGLRTFDHTYTCVPASCATNVTGSPSGGSAVVQVIGNVTGTVKVDVFFKRTGYDLVYLNYNIYSFVNMITANIRSMWRLMNDFKTRYSPIMLALIAIIGTIVLLGTAAEIGVYGLPLIVIAAFGLIFFAVIGFLNPLVVGLSLILGGVVYFRFSGGGDD
jgi:hypothetical protein